MKSFKSDCAVLNARPYEIFKCSDYKRDAHISLTGPFIRMYVLFFSLAADVEVSSASSLHSYALFLGTG